jgi:bifunctional non-homologous end joining protein LigD
MKSRASPQGRITLPAPGFIEPCIPTPAKAPPRGSDWLFELKLDGYRSMVRKAGVDVWVYSRRGADFTKRFPRLVDAARQLHATSALLDGEGVTYDQNGLPVFSLIHSKEYDPYVSMVAFDLLEKDSEDLRPLPLIDRKTCLQHLISKVKDGIEFVDHIDGDGLLIFKTACALGHEGIVAKRKDLPYESGRSRRWIKIKNPASPAARRVEDGSFQSWTQRAEARSICAIIPDQGDTARGSPAAACQASAGLVPEDTSCNRRQASPRPSRRWRKPYLET